MIGNWFNKLKIADSHPTEAILLACVDGELPAKQAAQVRAHLENCWSCRAQLDELQETITLFVSFRNQIQNPLVESPPSGWSDFDRKLAQQVVENESARVLTSDRLGYWQRFRQSLNLAEWSPTQIRIGVGATTALLIVALLWQMVGVRNVSAAELLENSIRAQRLKIGRINQPVVYQKVRLGSAGAKAVNWETWHDRVDARYRYALADERDGRRFIPVASNTTNNDAPDEPVLRKVAEVLRANRMNPERPLSAESFQSWRSSLASKRDEIEDSRDADGKQIFTLKTFALGATQNGKIAEAALILRADDWHAGALRLSVGGENGTSDFEFVETAFEIVSLSSLSPEIFPPDLRQPVKADIASAVPDAKPSPAVSPSPITENKATADSIVQPSPASAPPTPATAELEVEILSPLNRIGADIGEEATVTRNSAGELIVQGVVERAERKAEISRALAPLVGQPGLLIRIETSEEAQKRIERERTRTAVKNEPRGEDDEAASLRPLEVRDTIPADAEVRRHLRSKGTAENLLTGEVNRFATRAVNRSNQILLRALALKNLASRFSESRLRSMKPEARNQLSNLIASRAGEIGTQNRALRQELEAVYGDIGIGGEPVDADDEADLKRLIIRLSELAANNDRAVRAAFTFSAGASADGVKGAQFHESLGTIGRLANSIESAARRLPK